LCFCALSHVLSDMLEDTDHVTVYVEKITIGIDPGSLSIEGEGQGETGSLFKNNLTSHTMSSIIKSLGEVKCQNGIN